MIDYLLQFSDETEAKQILSEWLQVDEETEQANWQAKPQNGIMPVKIVLSEAILDNDGQVTTPIEYSDGYWLAIACPAQNEDLWSLPQCLHETDRKAANEQQSYQLRTKLSQEQISSVKRVEPVFAGSKYPFNP